MPILACNAGWEGPWELLGLFATFDCVLCGCVGGWKASLKKKGWWRAQWPHVPDVAMAHMLRPNDQRSNSGQRAPMCWSGHTAIHWTKCSRRYWSWQRRGRMHPQPNPRSIFTFSTTAPAGRRGNIGSRWRWRRNTPTEVASLATA